MDTTKSVEINYLSLPAETVHTIMVCADKLGVPPKEVCALMLKKELRKHTKPKKTA